MLHCHISASVAKSTPTPCKSRRGQQPLASVSHQPLLLHSSSSSCCHSTAALQPTSPTGWSQPISRSSSSSRKHTHRTAAAAPDTLVAEERSQQPTIDFLGVLNDMQTVRGVLETAADPDLVYSILVDYDSCSRVFRNISGSQTLFTDAGGKQVVQACGWQFLAFKGTFNVSLNVTEAPEDRLLVFTLAESSFMRDFEGRWQVQPLPGGGCRIEHVLAVKPILSIPAAISGYTSSIFKSQVAALLDDLEAEIDRQMEAAAAAAS